MPESTYLKKLRKKAKLSQEQLAEMCEVSRPAVTQWESGNTEPRWQHIERLAEIFGVEPGFLRATYSKPYDYEPDPAGFTKVAPLGLGYSYRPTGQQDNKYEMIPLLRASGECGNGHMNEHEEVEGELAFRRDWLQKMGIKAASLRVIYATGSSMYPSILDGDVLLVNIADQEPSSGKIYALRRPDGSISIKRLNEKFTGGWVISSDNPDKRSYPDEECDESTLHTLPIVGRIVWRGGSGF